MASGSPMTPSVLPQSSERARRRVTIRDVARHAGVSHQTVSRAINDAYGIDPTTRQRVLEVAQRLGFTPNSLAQGLARRRSKTIGLAIPTLTNPFFAEVTQAIIDAGERHGNAVVLVPTWETEAGEAAAVQTLLPRNVDGVIGFFERHTPEAILEQLHHSPFVLLNGESEAVSTVNVDIGAGMELAVQHLLELGHQRIALLDGAPSADAPNVRRERFIAAMARHGLMVESSWIPRAPNNLGGGRQAGEALLAAHPDVTAVIAYNDAMALGLIGLLGERGRSVPDDVSVVGFDGIQFGAVMQPVLTTIATDFARLAEVAIDELTRLIEGESDARPRRSVIETVLRRGGTTGRAHAASLPQTVDRD